MARKRNKPTVLPLNSEVDLNNLLLAGEAAVESSRAGKQLSREQMIRRIQNGEVAGGKILGQWMVDRRSLRDFIERANHGGYHA